MKPSYLEKHKSVLKTNERVNLFGEWDQGFFAMSFVGALNVGSINLHFDENLKTNRFYIPENDFNDNFYCFNLKDRTNEISNSFKSSDSGF